MILKFYNSLSQNIEEFPQKDIINIYSCGPTVYDYAHIGNLRTFLFEDLLIRTLKVFHYKVKHIRNLTDVDDKTIQKSQNLKISLQEFTKQYIEEFFIDLEHLNFDQSSTHYLKATEHINDMILLIQELIDKEHAYESEHGVYFKISSYQEYGNFAGLDLKNLKDNSSNHSSFDEKEEFGDFVLWKKYKFEDGQVFWDSPWGRGRPGWHTECAAMVKNSFPECLDIHTGGIDLLFPHHTNEKAHCECLSSTPMAKFWLHATHLLVNNKKMSKSLGNFYTMRDLLNKGFSARVIRFYLLTGAHYRSPLNFTLEGLRGFETALKRLDNFIDFLQDNPIYTVSYHLKRRFLLKLSEDLNISAAMGEIFNLINHFYNNNHYNTQEILNDLQDIDQILGIGLFKDSIDISSIVQDLFNQRILAREKKNWEESDRLREELLKLHYEVRDTKDGSSLKKICE